MFKGIKFYLIDRSSGTTYNKSKTEIKKHLSDNGALINFAVVGGVTNYVVIINNHNNDNNNNKNNKLKQQQQEFKPNPSLYNVYIKSKKLGVKIVSQEFITECIRLGRLIKDDSYLIKDVRSNGQVVEDVIHYSLFGDVIEEGDDIFGGMDELDEDESIYSDFNMNGLLDDSSANDDDVSPSLSSSSTSSNVYSSTFENEGLLEFNLEQEEANLFAVQYPHEIERYLKPIVHENGYAFYYDNYSNMLSLIELPSQLKMISFNQFGFMTFIDRKRNLYGYGEFTPSIGFNPIRKLLCNGGTSEGDEEKRFNQVSVNNRNVMALDEKGGCWYIDARSSSHSDPSFTRSYRTLTPLPLNIGSGNRVIMVSCGIDFSAILLDNFRVVTWGRNNLGQLGRKGSHVKPNPPGYITTIPPVTSISTGNSHAMVVCQVFKNNDTNGNHNDIESIPIYCWGSNQQGQLGLRSKVSDTSTPTLFLQTKSSSPSSKKKVFCCHDYSVIMEEPNIVTFYGKGVPFENELKVLMEMDSINDYQLFSYNKYIGIRVTNAYHLARGLVINNKVDLLNDHIKEYGYKISIPQFTNLLQLAVTWKSLEAFKYLFEKYPQARLDSNTSQTTIHIACRDNSPKILKFLLSTDQVDINQADLKDNETALHYSCRNNYFDCTLLLLQYGCNRNIKNSKGQTAFHLAVKDKNYPVSVLMAQLGAQSIPDLSMKTPIQYSSGEEKAFLQSLLFTNEVFLSYAHKDSSVVKDIRLAFESSSLRCWLDEYRLQAGCNWRTEITKGVENSNVVVFTISTTSIASLWCRKELKMAKKLCKPIIALYYQNLEIDPILQGLFDYELKFQNDQIQQSTDSTDPTVDILSSLSPHQRKLEFDRMAKIVQSIVNRSPLIKKIPKLNQTELYEKFKDRSLYATFTDGDHSLYWLVKEAFLNLGIPVMDRDHVLDGGKSRQEKIVLDKINKQKAKKQLKQQLNQQKSSNDTSQSSEDGSSANDMEEELIKRQQYYINLYSFTQDLFDKVEDTHLKVDSFTDDQLRDVDADIAIVKPYIQDCLFHIVAYTSSTQSSTTESIEKEIIYSKQLNKPIYVVTNDYQLRQSCTNTTLLSVPWYEIQYQREDLFYDQLISNYELLEKTLTLKQHQLKKDK